MGRKGKGKNMKVKEIFEGEVFLNDIDLDLNYKATVTLDVERHEMNKSYEILFIEVDFTMPTGQKLTMYTSEELARRPEFREVLDNQIYNYITNF